MFSILSHPARIYWHHSKFCLFPMETPSMFNVFITSLRSFFWKTVCFLLNLPRKYLQTDNFSWSIISASSRCFLNSSQKAYTRILATFFPKFASMFCYAGRFSWSSSGIRGTGSGATFFGRFCSWNSVFEKVFLASIRSVTQICREVC